jgi:hypothetical protein
MSSLCVVTTLQAPVHETLMFVNYHLNIGVDHMYLFFDDPDDPAVDALAGRERVTSVRCDLEYWNGINARVERSIYERQRANGRAALDMARQAGFDWVVHIDSDELLYAEKRLQDLLAAVPPEVHTLKFPTLEGVVDRLEYERPFQEISLFKVHPPHLGGAMRTTPEERSRLSRSAADFRRKLRWARWLGGSSIAPDGYLRGHIEGKSAVRTSAEVQGLGCHEPIPGANETVRATVADRGWLLHFDCRGMAGWKSKFQKLNNPRAEMSRHRRRHVERLAAIAATGDVGQLTNFYKDLYFLGPYDRFILTRLGLLRRVRLEPRLFQNGDEPGSAARSGLRPYLVAVGSEGEAARPPSRI